MLQVHSDSSAGSGPGPQEHSNTSRDPAAPIPDLQPTFRIERANNVKHNLEIRLIDNVKRLEELFCHVGSGCISESNFHLIKTETAKLHEDLDTKYNAALQTLVGLQPSNWDRISQAGQV